MVNVLINISLHEVSINQLKTCDKKEFNCFKNTLYAISFKSEALE